MADLTRVAEVLAEHSLWHDDAGGFNLGVRCRGRGCAHLRFIGDEAGATHQAEALAAAGLVATETEWGVASDHWPDGRSTPMGPGSRAREWATIRSRTDPWHVMTRNVTPWRAADAEAQR